MARACNCVGYLTNPGGVCCQDLKPEPYQIGTCAVPIITPDDIRRIVREELERSKR